MSQAPLYAIRIAVGRLCEGGLFLAPSIHRSARHATGQTTDVVLQGIVIFLELLVVGLDILDLLDQGVEPELQLLGVAVVAVSANV